MVEIALCIAIVAFAMVAIIGVLPTGVRVQRDNREETVVNADGSLWLEAIRGGAQGLDELTNYVDLITIRYSTGPATFQEQRWTFGDGKTSGGTNTFTNGVQIVGLLSIPKYGMQPDKDKETQYEVHAYVRALTGNAKEKPDGARNKVVKSYDPVSKANVDVPLRDMAFNYRLTPEIVPFELVPNSLVATNVAGLTGADRTNRLPLLHRTMALESNLFHIRLSMQWPVYHDALTNRVGRNEETFQTLAAGYLLRTNISKREILYRFQPLTFYQVR